MANKTTKPRVKRFRIRVSPHKGLGWEVEADGVLLPLFVRKKQALKVATSIALATQPSQVVIRKRNGQIEKEHTYAGDPRRRKG